MYYGLLKERLSPHLLPCPIREVSSKEQTGEAGSLETGRQDAGATGWLKKALNVRVCGSSEKYLRGSGVVFGG